MKVAVVGGGGFRTPLLLGALARVHAVESVVLHDMSEDRLERVAAVLRGLRRGGPLRHEIERTTDLERAVAGAGAVLAAIRPGGAEARVVDESVPLSVGVLGQETVGPGGICFALRSIPAMRRVASAVARLAPEAWLVNFTNPAGIVTEAVRDILGDRVVGVCDSPAALCARVAGALARPASSLSFDYAGLNHLGWLVGVDDAGGRDLLPGLLADDGRLARIEEATAFGVDRIRSLGALPNEYLLYLERAGDIVRTLRARGTSRGQEVASQQRGFFEGPIGTDDEMRSAWRSALDRRNVTYMDEVQPAEEAPSAPGSAGAVIEGPGGEGYAAVAADFLRAVSSDEPIRLILNTANQGRLGGIGDHEIVEVTCIVDMGRVQPAPGRRLPVEAEALVARIKEVERLTIRAATTGSAAPALEAIAAHPLVPSRDLAERILKGYLERQPGLRNVIA
jgi:6-phospho-beta-glucosidase